MGVRGGSTTLKSWEDPPLLASPSPKIRLKTRVFSALFRKKKVFSQKNDCYVGLMVDIWALGALKREKP
jgi:hypothetical protein